MTAEFSLEIESKHENSIIEELASDYSRYLDVDASKQVLCFLFSNNTSFRTISTNVQL